MTELLAAEEKILRLRQKEADDKDTGKSITKETQGNGQEYNSFTQSEGLETIDRIARQMVCLGISAGNEDGSDAMEQ